MKRCSGCKEELPLDCFGKNSNTKDGLQTYCKACKKEAQRRWNKKNREKRNRLSAEWREKNKEKYLASQKKYRETHYGKVLAKNAKRVADKLQRTPAWADQKELEKVYMNCPEGFVVDHDIPLRGETVSGLHVPENLRYLTPEENLSKGNKWQPKSIHLAQ